MCSIHLVTQMDSETKYIIELRSEDRGKQKKKRETNSPMYDREIGSSLSSNEIV